MKIGLNGSTTNQCTLLEDLEVAEQAGFDTLELRTYKLDAYLEDHSLAELADSFQRSTVRPYAINSVEFFNMKPELEQQKMLQETERWCRIASAIGCPYVIAVPSEVSADTPNETIIENTVTMLQQMGDIAASYDVHIAFEFIGYRSFSVNELSTANRIVSLTDHPRVGLVVDAYHFFIGGSTLQDLEEVYQEKLYVFHIDDAEDVPEAERTEANRVFPTLGLIPLGEIIDTLENIGYEGPASLELFRQEYWDMNKQTCADTSYYYVKKALNERPVN